MELYRLYSPGSVMDECIYCNGKYFYTNTNKVLTTELIIEGEEDEDGEYHEKGDTELCWRLI